MNFHEAMTAVEVDDAIEATRKRGCILCGRPAVMIGAFAPRAVPSPARVYAICARCFRDPAGTLARIDELIAREPREATGAETGEERRKRRPRHPRRKGGRK
jgi:hypothetical protein